MKERIEKLGSVTLAIAVGNIIVWIINIVTGGGSIWGHLWCVLFEASSMIGASSGIYVVLGMLIVLARLDKSREDFQLAKGHQSMLGGKFFGKI